MDSRTQDSDWAGQGEDARGLQNGSLGENPGQSGIRNGALSGAFEEMFEPLDFEASEDDSIEALQAALEQMTVPPCPQALRSMLDETSLEKLVYWKLQTLFERFEEAPPSNVLRTVHEHVERPLFSLVLKKTKGNQSRAAHVLGCNRNTLHRKLKHLAIQPSDVRRAIKLQNKRSFRSKIESMLDSH